MRLPGVFNGSRYPLMSIPYGYIMGRCVQPEIYSIILLMHFNPAAEVTVTQLDRCLMTHIRYVRVYLITYKNPQYGW